MFYILRLRSENTFEKVFLYIIYPIYISQFENLVVQFNLQFV